MEEVNTELSGGMHYIAKSPKILVDTRYTRIKTQITARGAS